MLLALQFEGQDAVSGKCDDGEADQPAGVLPGGSSPSS